MELTVLKYGLLVPVLMVLLGGGGVASAVPIRSPIVVDHHQQSQESTAVLANSSSAVTDCADAASDSLPITRIYADVLIPGRGPPVTPGLVVIQVSSEASDILYKQRTEQQPTSTATAGLEAKR